MATTGHESEHVTVAGLKGALQQYKTSISDTKMNASLKGAANGVAELDANGKVPSSQLPAFVDDVIEGYYYNSKFYKESTHTTEITGEGGKIYVDLSTEKTYRWSGSAYTQIKGDIVIGTSTGTAADGKVVADHIADTVVHITAAERTAWNAKGSYSKPSGGIPKTDLASAVQTSLGLADSALQSHQDISGKADKIEMDITAGTGTNADKTTITLKDGLSATVLTAHQDISGKQATVAKLGSTTQPLYTSAAGTFAKCTKYAGGSAVTLNGTSKSGAAATIYAPESAGTSGQVLVADANGVPSWGNVASVQTCEDIIGELV